MSTYSTGTAKNPSTNGSAKLSTSVSAGATLTNEQMWAIYAEGIAQAAGLPASPPNFILTGTSLIADLATASKALPPAAVPTVQEALFQVYNLANTELALQGIYSPSQHLFFNDYATYVDNLIPAGSQQSPTPTQQAQIQLLTGQLTTAEAQFNTDQLSAFAAWTAQAQMFPGKYPSFQSYLNGTSWGATLNNDSNAILGINSSLTNLYITIYGQDYVAIQANKAVVDGVRGAMQLGQASGPSDMLVQATSGTLVVPTYNPSDLNLFSSWVDSTIGQHGNAGQKPITINFGQSAAQYDFSKSQYFSQTNWSTNFFFFSASGGSTQSGSQVNVDFNSSSFSLEFQFDSITQVGLTRGPWYDSSLILPPYSYSNPNNLSTPTNLIIGMYPQVTMTMDAASYAAAYSAYNSASGFGFGAFWVSASHSQSNSTQSMSATWNSSNHSVVISSTSINPIILGMEVAAVPAG
jgi:hypothetical protein